MNQYVSNQELALKSFSDFSIMLVSKLQGSSSLYTFHARYVALSQSISDLVPMKTPVSEFVKLVRPDTNTILSAPVGG